MQNETPAETLARLQAMDWIDVGQQGGFSMALSLAESLAAENAKLREALEECKTALDYGFNIESRSALADFICQALRATETASDGGGDAHKSAKNDERVGFNTDGSMASTRFQLKTR